MRGVNGFDERILTLSGCEIGQLSVRHGDRLPTLDCGSGFTAIAASEYKATPIRHGGTYPSVRSSAPRALPVVGYQPRIPAIFLRLSHGGLDVVSSHEGSRSYAQESLRNRWSDGQSGYGLGGTYIEQRLDTGGVLCGLLKSLARPMQVGIALTYHFEGLLSDRVWWDIERVFSDDLR